jgi:hypothetical protein
VFSKADDRRNDRVEWSSRQAGRGGASRTTDSLQALAPGRASISAAAGAAAERWTVEVVSAAIASVEVRPSTAQARTGDVVHLSAIARDAQGREISGLTPSWLFTPGQRTGSTPMARSSPTVPAPIR